MGLYHWLSAVTIGVTTFISFYLVFEQRNHWQVPVLAKKWGFVLASCLLRTAIMWLFFLLLAYLAAIKSPALVTDLRFLVPLSLATGVLPDFGGLMADILVNYLTKLLAPALMNKIISWLGSLRDLLKYIMMHNHLLRIAEQLKNATVQEVLKDTSKLRRMNKLFEVHKEGIYQFYHQSIGTAAEYILKVRELSKKFHLLAGFFGWEQFLKELDDPRNNKLCPPWNGDERRFHDNSPHETRRLCDHSFPPPLLP